MTALGGISPGKPAAPGHAVRHPLLFYAKWIQCHV